MTLPRFRRAMGVLVLVLAASSCAGRAAAPGTDPWVREELWLGAVIPAGGEVTDADWDGFVRDEVAPRFRDGFSVMEAVGHWRQSDGEEIRERTRVLVVLHPEGDPAAGRAMEAIAAAYVKRFGQEAAMRTADPVRVRFVRP